MRIEEQVANIIENRGYNEIDPYMAYLVECDVLKNHLRDPEYLESLCGYELNQLVIDTWDLFHVERKPQSSQKQMWFDTLRDALESESIEAANEWPIGVNVAYGEQMDIETDNYMITVYRDNQGRYQRPIMGYSAEYLERSRATQVTETKGVFVYWNLHKAIWSVKSRTSGRVVAHKHAIAVTDAALKVSKKGRERVLSEGRKNVHAGVVGKVCAALVGDSREDLQRIRYNPYQVETFVTLEGEPVLTAKYVELRSDKTVWALL